MRSRYASVASLIQGPRAGAYRVLMSWKTIRLELAGTTEFPSGSVSRGYLIRVPLDDNGLIDEPQLSQRPQKATVRRFWSTEPDESGCVVRAADKWALLCNDDRLLPIEPPSFKVGEEVSVIDPNGIALPFRVASIRGLGRSDHRL